MFVERDGAIYFPLTLGYETIIDAGDFHVLNDKWFAYVGKSNVYAATQRNGKRKLLHLELVGAPKGVVVDHFNGNSLDNRRWNFRLGSNADNGANIERHASSGVQWDSSRECWYARITWRTKDYFIGRFDDHTEAVLATQAKRQSLMDADPHFRGETGATDHSLLHEFLKKRSA